MKTKVLNLYGGPGTGKSTTAAAVFSELKQRGVNCELVQEYAKDKAWEFDGHTGTVPKVLQAQEYVFAKQHFRMRRCADAVDLIITDSPLLLATMYIPDDFALPSLKNVIREAYDMYDNIDIFLNRAKAYNPRGRFQTEKEAVALDSKILRMLIDQNIGPWMVTADENVVNSIIHILSKNSRN